MSKGKVPLDSLSAGLYGLEREEYGDDLRCDEGCGRFTETVSRVLNGDAPVGERTHKAVKATIREIGYVPSKAARMMRSNKSGLLTGAISNTPGPAGPMGLPDLFIFQGIQKAIAESSRTTVLEAGALDKALN